MNPCWLGLITWVSFMSRIMALRMICSMAFPGTKVRLTGLEFPGSSFRPFLWMGVTFARRQSAGTSPVCQDFCKAKKTFSGKYWKRGSMLDLDLTNKEGLMGNVKLKGSLGCSDHEIVDFRFPRADRRVHSKCSSHTTQVAEDKGRDWKNEEPPTVGQDQVQDHLKRCPIPGSVQGQEGWSFEQPSLVEAVPARGRGLELDNL
ncbi:hypothetical protein llap_12357 [Limosa lapponica baueri]|uniref:Uncharacterized protein n=1 Tax=Limosa lapponica baueri TaxID=1758121 RepID=A0A2I0TU96_LIMLA|nr:hypothetical protein llap_12357 [Limosa lapponica baueri]